MMFPARPAESQPNHYFFALSFLFFLPPPPRSSCSALCFLFAYPNSLSILMYEVSLLYLFGAPRSPVSTLQSEPACFHFNDSFNIIIIIIIIIIIVAICNDSLKAPGSLLPNVCVCLCVLMMLYCV